MRARGEWTPIIFLTARDDEVDRVLGLELGADDIAGPRTVDVHVAQVRAKLGEAADLLRTVRGVGYAARRPPAGAP